MTTKKEDCPFKSPEELGLSLKERDALIKTLLLMEAGKVIHVKGDFTTNGKLQEGEYGFRMSNWRDQYECGTVACIGGTAELLGGMPRTSLGVKAMNMHHFGKSELYNLFYRWGGSNPSPKEAAKVLRGYLTTGRTRW